MLHLYLIVIDKESGESACCSHYPYLVRLILHTKSLIILGNLLPCPDKIKIELKASSDSYFTLSLKKCWSSMTYTLSLTE